MKGLQKTRDILNRATKAIEWFDDQAEKKRIAVLDSLIGPRTTFWWIFTYKPEIKTREEAESWIRANGGSFSGYDFFDYWNPGYKYSDLKKKALTLQSFARHLMSKGVQEAYITEKDHIPLSYGDPD